MAFFFRNRSRTDLVKPANDLLVRLWEPPKLQKVGFPDRYPRGCGADWSLKTEEELAKLLATMKSMLTGTQGLPPLPSYRQMVVLKAWIREP